MIHSNLKFLTFVMLCGSIWGMAGGSNSDFHYAPPPYKEGSMTLVPVDIEQQHVSWLIAGDLSTVEAQSQLTFSINASGHPLFLLNPNTKGSIVSITGSEPVSFKKVEAAPFAKSNFYYIDKFLEPGTYQLQLQCSFKPDLEKSYFLPIQYNKHAFGEAGIPGNYVYDHFKLKLDVTINHPSPNKYRFITNGMVTPGENRIPSMQNIPRTLPAWDF